MAASAHALLGPSSSHRWLNCTPSARLEEHVVDKGSDFAQEGSCAHALCEEKLYLLLGDADMAEEARKEQIKNNRDRWYNAEMENATDDYVTEVWNHYQDALKATPDAKLFIERRLDFTKWIPESFGTADAVIICDGTMEVIDFKYGKGVEVSAVGNTQMMIYALGALNEFGMEYDIKHVRMTIIQPRMSNFSDYDISAEELQGWGENVLKPTAQKAWDGEGEQSAGEWCRFCKIKATCAKLANQAVAAYTQNENKESISDEAFPDILKLIPAIKSWCTAVEDYALAKAIGGHEFNGFKVVEGRSIRKVTDPNELYARLVAEGYEPADIYKPAELKAVGELEKLTGKAKFATLAKGCIDKPQGKPTLVPNTDKRAPMKVNSAADDFANVP